MQRTRKRDWKAKGNIHLPFHNINKMKRIESVRSVCFPERCFLIPPEYRSKSKSYFKQLLFIKTETKNKNGKVHSAALIKTFYRAIQGYWGPISCGQAPKLYFTRWSVAWIAALCGSGAKCPPVCLIQCSDTVCRSRQFCATVYNFRKKTTNKTLLSLFSISNSIEKKEV